MELIGWTSVGSWDGGGVGLGVAWVDQKLHGQKLVTSESEGTVQVEAGGPRALLSSAADCGDLERGLRIGCLGRGPVRTGKRQPGVKW